MYPQGPSALPAPVAPQGLGMQPHPGASMIGPGSAMGATVGPAPFVGGPTMMGGAPMGIDPITGMQTGSAPMHMQGHMPTQIGPNLMTSTPTAGQGIPGVAGTTPIAGSGPFMPVPVTPIRASTQPMMISTPLATGPGQ